MKKALITLSILFTSLLGQAQTINAEKFKTDAVSIIQFYGYERAIQRNEEEVALFFAGGDASDTSIVRHANKDERILQQDIKTAKVEPRYEPFRKQIDTLMIAIIKCFDNLYKYGQESKQFKASNAKYQPILERNMDEFFDLFKRSNYITVDSAIKAETKKKAYNMPYTGEEEVEDLLRKDNAYSAYKIIIQHPENMNNPAALMVLGNICFKEKYADSIKHNIHDNDSAGLSYYSKILTMNKYSPFLEEAWFKWRTVTQYAYNGLSKTSDIPNDQYDSARFTNMRLIVNYINNNPNDLWAYLQFFKFADEEIIHRFGPYPYGNQVTIDYHGLFDEPKKKHSH